MRYVEYRPDNRLAEVVRCYWVFECDTMASAAEERVVPDGSPELIFHYGDPFAAIVDGVVTAQPAHLFAGQLTRPLHLRPRGRSGLISVRFTPWGARRLLRMPMSGLVNAFAATDALAEPWLDRIDGEIDGCRSDADRVALIERVFLERLGSCGAPETDQLVVHCAKAIIRGQGRQAIDGLIAHSSPGPRQLERRFNDAIGMPPKAFASIIRFRALLSALERDASGGWLAAALDSGYFDQPHMIRDFRRFAGVSPRAFVASLPAFSRAVANV